MKNLTTFTFLSETTLGSIALGALWLSPWPTLIKISFSCALILLCISQDLASLQRSLQSEQQIDFFDLGIRSLEHRLINADSPLFSEIYQSHLEQQALKNKITGNGSAYAISLLAKYAIWAIGAAGLYWLAHPMMQKITISNW